MKFSEFIEGLQILQPHFAKDGYHIGAEHDQFYVYATQTPLTDAEFARMRELGWFQEDSDDENPAYDPTEGWSCFT